MPVKIATTVAELDEYREVWPQLLERSNNRSITQTWEWMKTWWDVYGEDRELLLACKYKQGVVVGIAPLSLAKMRTKYFGVLKYKTAWLLGSGKTTGRGVVSDYLDFIVEKGEEEDFVRALLGFLKECPEWEEIILENISCESSTPRMLTQHAGEYGLSCEIISRTPSILIKLPGSWDEYLQGISSSLRYKISKGRREFEKLGGVYHLVREKEELPVAFEKLGSLHQYRWTSRGEPGAFSSEQWKDFHRRFMGSVFEKGWIKLSFLEIEGKPVAANYNFAFDRKIHYFQSGLIPHENKHVRLGLILHSFCIEEAINEGFEEYDFLQAGSKGAGYKEIWGNYSRDLFKIRIARRCNKERVYWFLNRMFNTARSVKNSIS